jgi:tRNA-(ms[2]io[6]A)-hydroxylase
MLCLKVPTDGAWAVAALRDIDGVLADHAHCELKAASNALSLSVRSSGDLELVRALTDVAREEIEHFQQVLSLLASRGVGLGSPPVDAYAAELRRVARDEPRAVELPPLVDRFLVAALIEARSCERFKLLSEASAGDPACRDLTLLWGDLLAAEARHYRTFLDLALRAAGGDRARVIDRLDRLAALEGAIVRALGDHENPCRAAIHG